jgi:heavy metal sensor kinase
VSFTSIRFRLAAWYFLSFALILALFAAGAWIAMRAAIRQAVDHELNQRIQDVREFIAQELDLGDAELLEELQEHSLLGLGGGLLQLSEATGRVLFRSGRLRDADFDLPHPAPGDASAHFATRSANGLPIRAAARIVTVKGRPFLIQVAAPIDEFDESIVRFETGLLLLAPVFLLLAAGSGFWMSSRALAPVDRITSDARSISVSNLSARLAVPPARDELQRLTETLNEMLGRIESEVKRIVQFTADASHELRAPLSVIHAAAEFSLRRERTRDELIDAMRKILRESERTASLINDLLQLARADSQAHELAFAPTDLGATGRDAASQAVTLGQAKNIQIATDIPAAPIYVSGNERLLEQLWMILLDNAVKYTPDGGQVRLAMQAANSHSETIVTDTGVGISPDDLPHVYDRFWRADKVRSRTSGGAGLGLAIARWIVEAHHGEIEIRSQRGSGSEVRVRLPLTA